MDICSETKREREKQTCSKKGGVCVHWERKGGTCVEKRFITLATSTYLLGGTKDLTMKLFGGWNTVKNSQDAKLFGESWKLKSGFL